MFATLVTCLCALLVPCSFLVIWWWQRRAREQFWETIEAMAEKERDEIGGESVEHWLNLLNRGRAQPLVASDAMVLIYQGREWFFVDGGIMFLGAGKHPTYETMKAFFLVAIGPSAVQSLAEQEGVFRLITGSTELAAFSVYRWSDFVEMLVAERRH